MNLNHMSRQARLIARGEMLALQARLGFVLRRVLVAGFALLFAGMGLVFLNIGLFAWLTPLWGPVWTPAGLGLLNLLLALGALVFAAFMRPGPEVALAEEIRNMAGEQLQAEIGSAPLAGGVLVPALTAIIGALAKRRQDKG